MQTGGLQPQLKSYDDYRAFLRDYASFRKGRNSGWSYAVWAHRLGLQSKSSLVMVIRGQRDASRSFLQKIVKYLKFNETEESYFRTLVRVSGKNKIHVHEVPAILRDSRPEVCAALSAEESSRLVEWKTFVTKEAALLNSSEFKLDQATLDVLIKSGLLTMSSGRFNVGQGKPTIPWTPESVRALHLETLDASKRAFEELSPEERAFRLSFVRMKKEKMAEAVMVLRKFQKDFTDAFDDADGDDVFELNLHYFAATRGLKN